MSSPSGLIIRIQKLSEADLCEEERALADAKLGQSPAFARLVRAHQAAVYSLALRVLLDREQARDLAQETFLQLYRKLSTVESARHLKFWLRKVTMNLAIDKLRQLPKVEFASLDEDIAMDVAPDADPYMMRLLRKFISELPPAPRAVVLLKYQEDLDPTEIAVSLDMSINTVKSHLRRSLAIIKEKALASTPEISNGEPRNAREISL